MDVIVIGGANIDIKAKCVHAHVAATSNPSIITTKSGGVARNIAHNLARLSVNVSLLSAVGKDAAGETLLAATAATGVDVSLSFAADGATGTYIAFLDEKGELITAANDMAVMRAITPNVIRQRRAQIENAKLVLADCNLSEETLNEIATLAAHKMIVEPVSVEKSKRLMLVLRNHSVYLATPNLDQSEILTNSRDPVVAAQILHQAGLQNLVIYMGNKGAFAFDGSSKNHIATQAQNVVDVTGAGDAATAGLIRALLKGLPLAKAAEFGQEMAARVLATTASTLE